MICWSCEKNVKAEPFCSACRAILPLEGKPNHFDVLQAPQRFSQDLAALERTYKESARAVHPDKFARAGAQARRAAMQRTVALNEAWRTLRDPVLRAEYLVRLAGIEVGAEDGTLRRTEAGQEKIPVPPDLLAEVLEQRELLMEAQLEEDQVTVRALGDAVKNKLAQSMHQAQTALDAEPPKADLAAQALVAARYHRRFLQAIDEQGG